MTTLPGQSPGRAPLGAALAQNRSAVRSQMSLPAKSRLVRASASWVAWDPVVEEAVVDPVQRLQDAVQSQLRAGEDQPGPGIKHQAVATADDRLQFLAVPDEVLHWLRKRRIPFAVDSR